MHPDIALRIAQDRQARERDIRDLWALAAGAAPAPSLRRRIGESFIRLGQRLAASPDPAWSR